MINVRRTTLRVESLFGHPRRGWSFWRAATISMLPFVAVHVFLFLQCRGRLRWRPCCWPWRSLAGMAVMSVTKR